MAALAQRLEHRLEQVQPLDIDAGLQARQQNPARAAGDVQYRAIRLARQSDIEIKPVRDVFEHQVVRVAIIKDRRQAVGGLFVHADTVSFVVAWKRAEATNGTSPQFNKSRF